MSFGKVFAINIIATIVLNAIFIILAHFLGYGINDLITRITLEPIYILFLLFAPLGRAIWLNFEEITYSIETENILFLLVNIAYIIAPLIATIITGRLSDKRTSSLLAFIITAVISMLVCVILVFYSFSFQRMIGQDFSQEAAILNVMLGSIVNGCLYGFIALALTKKS